LATATHTDWMAVIVEQLGTIDDDPKLTHAVVYLPADRDTDEPDLLDRCDSKTAALVSAEDWATKVGPGEVTIVPLADLLAWHRDNGHAVELDPILTVEPRRQNVDDDPPAREVEQDDAAEEPDEDDQVDLENDSRFADGVLDAAAAAQAAQPAPGETGPKGELFDPSEYDREDLAIPKVDGQSIDRISVKFAGEIFLDRSSPSDVKVYNDLRLGKDVQLLVEAKCSSTAAKGATDREGDLDVVVATKGLKVHSLIRPAGADWIAEAE
jgi:hypothetical protein